MRNELKEECLAMAKEMRRISHNMLDNAPQEMSNVTLILNALAAANHLINHWGDKDDEGYEQE